MPPRPLEDLYRGILRPLYATFCVAEPEAQAAIMKCYTDIVVRYASFDWAEYDREADEQGGVGDVFVTSSFSLLPRADYMRTIYEVVQFVDSVCSVGLHLDRNNLLLVNRIVGFYEVSPL